MARINPPFIIKLLNRFSYAQKFIIISMLFAFSLLVSGYFMVLYQFDKIRVAELELKGISYERALQKLIEKIPEHEWKIYTLLSGDTHLKNDTDNLSTEIDADFKYLSSIDLELQNELATLPEEFQKQDLPNLKPLQLELQWNEIQNTLPKLTRHMSNALHDQLISNLHHLMLYIGETSNLLVDPTAEVNYLIQTILWDLPKAQVLIPRMITIMQKIINLDSSTKETKEKLQEDRDQLIILSSELKENLKNLKNDTRKAMHRHYNSENSKVDTNDILIRTLNKYFDSSNEWILFIEDFLKKIDISKLETPIGQSNEYLLVATSALETNFTLWEASTDKVEQILTDRIAKYKRQLAFSIIISLISAIIGLTLGIYIMKQISNPLADLVDAAKRLTEGDLSTRVPIADDNEIGQVGIAFNNMAEAFQEIIGKLRRNSEQLTISTAEIASAARQQETSILEQETTTKQIAKTARNISATGKKFAKTMNDVSSNAEQTSALAASGKAGLNQMEIIMQQMVDASQNIAAKLAVLNEKASNITSVITTITKVADQTNLLSLNAAIEAEKAGEHGRTFSVIAREIRRLADQTGNATLDIEKMVTEIVSAISGGVMSVDKFSEEIDSGVSQVVTVGGQLTKIIEQVQLQTVSFENVNKGIQAQSVEAEQINESINQLSEAAQQASKSIKQFHTAIEQLNHAALDMQFSVTQIKQ